MEDMWHDCINSKDNPTDPGDYLVVVKYEFASGEGYINYREIVPYSPTFGWGIPNHRNSYVVKAKITHWANLPAFPVGGRQ